MPAKHFLDTNVLIYAVAKNDPRASKAEAEKYGYSIYDALVASAALEAGCKTLYSEDLQDGQIINRQLTIRNPFR